MQFQNYCLFAALGLVLGGCDQDVFGLSCRSVAGTYCLHRWEDGKTYYLEDKTQERKNSGGVIDGVVEQIGWHGNYIVAKRHSTFAGDSNGWVVIDVSHKTISGPYDDASLSKLSQTKGIIFFDPAKAWDQLR